MFQTDFVHTCQLFACPNASAGIVGVAEKKNGGLFVRTFRFEIVPVYFETVVCPTENRFKDFTTIVTDGGEETVVVRREDEDFFTRHSKRLDGNAHGWYDTCGIENLFTVDRPLMTALKPRDDSLVIVVSYNSVAEDTMLGSLLDCCLDSRCGLEVHVGHPKGNDFLIGTFIPFHTTSVSSLYQFIKIKSIHLLTPFLLTS